MAIFYVVVKAVSRSSGKSAVAASAYRSATCIEDREVGETCDYRYKSGEVVHSEINLPPNAPADFANREILWNSAQEVESAPRARLYRDVLIALPREFDHQTDIEVLRSYINDNFVSHGMCVDWSIHDKGDGNPHAHLMLTTRPIDTDGNWKKLKEKKIYLLDELGHKVPLIDPDTGQQKVRDRTAQGKGIEKLWVRVRVEENPFDENHIDEWRKNWSSVCNERLDAMGADRISNESYARQGIEKLPMHHEGYAARKIEAEGGVSNVCQENRDIKAINYFIEKSGDRIEKDPSLLEDIMHMVDMARETFGQGIVSVTDLIVTARGAISGFLEKFDWIERIKTKILGSEKIEGINGTGSSDDRQKNGGIIEKERGTDSTDIEDFIRQHVVERLDKRELSVDTGRMEQDDTEKGGAVIRRETDPIDVEEDLFEGRIDNGL